MLIIIKTTVNFFLLIKITFCTVILTIKFHVRNKGSKNIIRPSIDLCVHGIIPYREVDQTNDEETKGWFHSHVTKFSLRSSHS